MAQVEHIAILPHDVRVHLLRELGYDTDGEFVLTAEGKKYRDPCTGDAVRLDNMAICQGSAIVLDDNPLSLDWYMDQYPGHL